MQIWKFPILIINYEMPAGLEEARNDEENRLFTVFKELLIRNADTKYELYEGDTKCRTPRPRTLRDKVYEVVNTSRESWIQIYKPKKGQDKGKDFVVI